MDALTARINTLQQPVAERKLRIIVELIVPWPPTQGRSAVVNDVYEALEANKPSHWIVDTVKACVGVV